MPDDQFANRKGLCCTDALLNISHRLQMSLDAGMESCIVQLDISAAFDGVSHCGLLFKLKSICVGGSVLSICTELFSDCRQRVGVDGATSVLGPLLFIPSSSEMFELVENSLFAYANDSTLLAVTRKPAHWPAVAAFLHSDLARIQEWCMQSMLHDTES